MGFVASIIVKKFGLEAKNKITWVTKETEEKFRRYPKAITNFRAAKSAGDLTVFFEKDLTSMESVSDLNQKLYDKIYLICPRFTEDIKAGENDADAKDAEDAEDKDAKKQLAFEKEQQEQAEPKVIEKNKKFVEDLLRNAASLISKQGVIIVLHHTGTPYSEWNLDKIAEDCGLEKLDGESFDPHLYPHFSPLKAGSDLNLKRIPSAFYCYRLE